MSIPLEYEIGLDITPSNAIEKGWGSILHFTATGADCCGYGSRIPGVWFWPGTRRILLSDGHTSNGNSHTGQWKCDDNVLTLQPNINYRLRMVFKAKTVSLYVNGQMACATEPRADRKVFKNVAVYAADPFYAPAKATVQNLYFKPLPSSPPGLTRLLIFLYVTFDKACVYICTTLLPHSMPSRCSVLH